MSVFQQTVVHMEHLDCDKSDESEKTKTTVILEQIISNWQNGRYLAAFRLCQKLYCTNRSLYDEHSMIMKEISEKVEILHEAERKLRIPPGFPCLRVQDAVSVFDSDVGNGKELGLLFDSLLEAPFYFLCVVLKEIGLYKNWNPLLTDMCYMSGGGGFSKDKWQNVHLWWHLQSPIPMFVDNRDACVTVTVYDCLDEKDSCIFLVISPNNDKTVPAGCHPETVRMRVASIVIRLHNVRENRVRVSGFLHVNMNLRFTPLFVQKQAASSAICDVVQAWVEQARLASTAYKNGNRTRNKHVHATENDEEFYEFLSRRLQELHVRD